MKFKKAKFSVEEDYYDSIIHRVDEILKTDRISVNLQFILVDIYNKLNELDKKINKKINVKEEYINELLKIKGIGEKTVLDIIVIYPEKEDLVNAINSEEHLPFTENINKLLKENIK